MKSLKIALPIYKIMYSFIFLILLSLVRGISGVFEIGATLDPMVSLLAVIFCADTFEMEHREKRWEIFTLLPIKKQTWAITIRLFLQILYLFVAACAGYWFFYWQKPRALNDESQAVLYMMYLLAVAVSIFFWSVLSLTLTNLFRNQWVGIGACIILWLGVYSKAGEAMLGKFNIFAYIFTDSNKLTEFTWLWGKGLWCAAAILMTLTISRQLMHNKRR